jgi:hypothetical protein
MASRSSNFRIVLRFNGDAKRAQPAQGTHFMPIYEVTDKEILPVEETTFNFVGLQERRDLQRLGLQDIVMPAVGCDPQWRKCQGSPGRVRGSFALPQRP